MSLSKLKFQRLKSGLSQRQVGIKLGITKSYLSKMENQHRQPTDKLFRELSALYGVEILDLIGNLNMGNGRNA